MIGEERSLLKTIKTRKVTYFGHILRHNSFQKILLEGTIEGKKKRGKPRKDWMDNIEDWTYLSYEECSRKAQHRTWWRLMVVDLLAGEDT